MILLTIASGVHITKEIPHETYPNCCCYKTYGQDLYTCNHQEDNNLVDRNGGFGEIILQWQ